jgi:multiple sugar transport system substrate-binding protein
MVSQSGGRAVGVSGDRRTRPLNRRMLLKQLGTVVAGSAFTTLLPSCRGMSSTQTTTLTLWDYFTSPGKGYMNLFNEYMAVNPSVFIQRTTYPFSDLKQRLALAEASRQLPDIVVIDNPDHTAFAARGILADITDQIKAWGKINQYFAGPVKSTMWQGRYYGMPNNSNCLALYYNKDMLEAAGVVPPTNWDELREAARKLSKDGVYGYAMSFAKSEEGVFQFLPFLWQAGADLRTIDSPEAVSALEFLVQLIKDNLLSYESLDWTQQDTITQFITGQAAMCLNGPWNYPLVKQEAKFRYGIVQAPQGKQKASILGGENWAIIKKSSHVKEAWDFIKWTQKLEPLKEYIFQDVRLPSSKSLAQDPTFQKDPNLAVFIAGLEAARPRAYGVNYPQISQTLQLAIQSAISGRMSSFDALTQAGAKIKPLLPS